MRHRYFSTSSSLVSGQDENENKMDDKTDTDTNTWDIPNDNSHALFFDNNAAKIVSSKRRNQSHHDIVEKLFESDNVKIAPDWKSVLLAISRPSVQAMVAQLNGQICPMGYDPVATPYNNIQNSNNKNNNNNNSMPNRATRKQTLLSYVREEKNKLCNNDQGDQDDGNDKSPIVMLVRVGEFYEAFGLDAVLLVEYCGLNSMGGKARAGCPIRNLQATLDCLTGQGFRVAVYEEQQTTPPQQQQQQQISSTPKKGTLKTRMLGQVVSPANPTYLYNLVLSDEDTVGTHHGSDVLAGPSPRPFVGILDMASGYTLVEVQMQEQSVRILERLTPEAVACRLEAHVPSEPLLYVSPTPLSESSAFNHLRQFVSCLESIKIKRIDSSLTEEPRNGVSELERAKRIVVRSLLNLLGEESRNMKESDFILMGSEDNDNATNMTRTNPLHLETAKQLGLMSGMGNAKRGIMDSNVNVIPSLVKYLLPSSAPQGCRQFLRSWLLNPPPPKVSLAMSALVKELKTNGPALPPLSVSPLGKLVALLRSQQASAHVYGEILSSLVATMEYLQHYSVNDEQRSRLVDPLMILLEFESGLRADTKSLYSRCHRVNEIIEDVINPFHHARLQVHSSQTMASQEEDVVNRFDDAIVPNSYFERNEAPWRGRVRPEVARDAYDRVKKAANDLTKAIQQDFMQNEMMDRSKNQIVVHDIFNNLILLKEKPANPSTSTEYIHPRDRNGKLLKNRYTTENVQKALSEYVASCEYASAEVTRILRQLSQTLCDEGHLPTIVQAVQFNLLLSTASLHAGQANTLGWSMAKTMDDDLENDIGIDGAGRFINVWPYWMEKTSATPNTFDLNGMFLLTAPNMSGKSTLMRSTAAAALLTISGLCAPLDADSTLRRFDHLFVRGASADVPSENKSAFGAEMQDVASLLRSCGSRSLVFVDELGRGTSPKDGTSIAAAVLEDMSRKGMNGFFATHLHDVLDLVKKEERIRTVRMAIEYDNENDVNRDGYGYKWTYCLEDGVCNDSLALVTAARFGLPQNILDRAFEFASSLEQQQQLEVTDMKTTTNLQELTTFGSEIDHQNDDGNGVNRRGQSLEGVVKELAEIPGLGEAQPWMIPAHWSSPSALEGRSCLYVLQLENGQYYVGETDALANRLKQHRVSGRNWQSAAAFPIKGGKGESRNIESRVIQRLVTAGYNLSSTTDGRRSQKNLKP